MTSLLLSASTLWLVRMWADADFWELIVGFLCGCFSDLQTQPLWVLWIDRCVHNHLFVWIIWIINWSHMKNKGTKLKSKKKGSENAFGCDLIEHLQNSGQDGKTLIFKVFYEQLSSNFISTGQCLHWKLRFIKNFRLFKLMTLKKSHHVVKLRHNF